MRPLVVFLDYDACHLAHIHMPFNDRLPVGENGLEIIDTASAPLSISTTTSPPGLTVRSAAQKVFFPRRLVCA